MTSFKHEQDGAKADFGSFAVGVDLENWFCATAVSLHASVALQAVIRSNVCPPACENHAHLYVSRICQRALNRQVQSNHKCNIARFATIYRSHTQLYRLLHVQIQNKSRMTAE